MSGLAGILRFDDGPVDDRALTAMTAAMAHRGPDGTDRWVGDRVGLAHLQHRTTPRSLDERQPLLDRSGQVCLTLDGRVDDRAGLVAALGRDQALLRDGSDAELVLAGYLRWGRAGLGRIVGDFALALWDGRTQELVCARDALGQRPFLYHRSASGLRWASEPVGLLADAAVPRQPNPGMVAELLANSVTSTTETVHEGVLRLPPAHLLVATPDGRVRTERFWSWDPERVAEGTDDELIEGFLDVFRTAVASCLSSPGPVGLELSGGMDSSSVVATAAGLAGDHGREQDHALEVFSLVFPGRACDETELLRAVSRQSGLVTREYEPHPLGAAFYEADTAATLDLPQAPTLAMHHAHAVDARALGCQALLTGRGGDEWFTGSPLVYADDLRRGRLRGLRQRARADRLLWPAPSAAHQLARHGLLPLLPDAGQRLLGLGAARHRPVAEWIPAAFRRSVALDDRIRPHPVHGPDLARADVARSLDDARTIRAIEVHERAMARVGVELRSPFNDRRVVELALSLPDRVRRRNSATKWVVRRAMEGTVPDVVRFRSEKATFEHVFLDELEAQGGRALFQDLAIEDLGWVDGPTLRAGYDRLAQERRQGTANHRLWEIWTSLSTERWIRAIVRT